MKPVAVVESQLAYWQERLAGASVVELPTDRRRAGVAVPGRAWVPVRLDREVTDRLADIIRREGLGLDVALLAAFVALQHRYTDQDDLVVGSLGVGGAPSVGDPVPVRLDVVRDVTGRTFMAQVGDVVAEALDHGDISFHELAKDLCPHPGPARRPLYQTLFLWGEQDDLEAFTRSEILDHGTSMLDASMALMESPAGVEGVVEFNTDLFDRETIEAFVVHFGVVVASLVADPDRTLSRTEVLTDAERRVLLEDWTDITIAATYHECFTGEAGDPPIGRPLPNIRVYVVDRDLQLVPIGVAGELCVSGACVARGDLGRPDLTEERLVPDPFGPPGQRLYRTGDRGRWRRDGTLELLGRLDDSQPQSRPPQPPTTRPDRPT